MKCGTPLSRRSRNVDLLSRTTSLLKRSMMLICCVDIYTRTHFQTLRVFGQSPGWTLCSVITMLRWNSHHAVSSRGSPSGLSSTTCLPPPHPSQAEQTPLMSSKREYVDAYSSSIGGVGTRSPRGATYISATATSWPVTGCTHLTVTWIEGWLTACSETKKKECPHARSYVMIGCVCVRVCLP